jgi:hypothetical protein
VKCVDGSQVVEGGISVGCQVKSIGGEKVSTVGEFKAVLTFLKEQGKQEAVLTFEKGPEMPVAVPIS